MFFVILPPENVRVFHAKSQHRSSWKSNQRFPPGYKRHLHSANGLSPTRSSPRIQESARRSSPRKAPAGRDPVDSTAFGRVKPVIPLACPGQLLPFDSSTRLPIRCRVVPTAVSRRGGRAVADAAGRRRRPVISDNGCTCFVKRPGLRASVTIVLRWDDQGPRPARGDGAARFKTTAVPVYRLSAQCHRNRA